ncbi:GNAT family N-acetyltransferase [Fulvivirga sedimenti]|uniref:GNAT family N-acetyltransferase n=1 Tax=Fulvivirga sedimenti TaxID=2879465 RepID=A0A9X1KWZ6_9BACT|nr:GNAT family N-acetyltransferase [Fulvivirga sedimenti]MCA6073742.1 GNAT family N-acetyltransferase [Fulvivirga sedimenti]
MSNIHLKPVLASEIGELAEISYRTFDEAFRHLNNPDDFNAFIAEAFTIEKISHEFHNPEVEFYFANAGDERAGYMKLNHGNAQTEHELDNALEIERIYVDSKFQGMKIGEFMVNFAIEKALQKKHDWIWLGVWEKNTRAIQFYERHAFIKFSKHTFIIGNDPQTDILMRRSLNL